VGLLGSAFVAFFTSNPDFAQKNDVQEK